MKKNAKGITLVAMVITIIVMLILAGVSISMVVGENGVLTRASNSAVKTNLASVAEDFNVAVSDVEMQYQSAWAVKSSVASKKGKYFTVERLNDSLSQSKISTTITNFTPSFSELADVGISDSNPNTTVKGKSISTLIKEDGSVKNTADGEGIIMYLSNGKSSTEIGSDVYVAVCTMEDGIPKLVNLGILLEDLTTNHKNGSIKISEMKPVGEADTNKSVKGMYPTDENSIDWLY